MPKVGQKTAGPTQPLPTRRMAFAKQLEILRAYPAICGTSARSVTNAEIASVVDLAPDTVGMANPFFLAIGLLERNDRGCTPCQELMAFYNAHRWNPETAMQKLAPVFERAWFGVLLLPKLRFRSHGEDEVLTILAEASAATPEYRPQLKMVIDYLESVGIVACEDGTIRLAQDEPRASEEAPMPSSPHPTAHADSNGSANHRTAQVATSFSREGQGALDLNIRINVDMAELAKWSPDRITAFMSGLAQVLAAKGEMEKKESQ